MWEIIAVDLPADVRGELAKGTFLVITLAKDEGLGLINLRKVLHISGELNHFWRCQKRRRFAGAATRGDVHLSQESRKTAVRRAKGCRRVHPSTNAPARRRAHRESPEGVDLPHSVRI